MSDHPPAALILADQRVPGGVEIISSRNISDCFKSEFNKMCTPSVSLQTRRLADASRLIYSPGDEIRLLHNSGYMNMIGGHGQDQNNFTALSPHFKKHLPGLNMHSNIVLYHTTTGSFDFSHAIQVSMPSPLVQLNSRISSLGFTRKAYSFALSRSKGT